MKKLYLDYHKAVQERVIVDREAFLQKYQVTKTGVMRNGLFVQTIVSDTIQQPMKMLQGTPLLVNVEGTYIEVKDLLKVCKRKDYGKVLRYVKGVYGEGLPPEVDLMWDRER